MKIALNVLGIILVLLGIVWILQGVNVLPGSFMSGQSQWAIIGLVVGVVGAVVLVFTNRRPTVKRS